MGCTTHRLKRCNARDRFAVHTFTHGSPSGVPACTRRANAELGWTANPRRASALSAVADDVIDTQDHRSVSELASLVRLAVDSDDPAPLVGAAQVLLADAVALASEKGDALAHAPDDVPGRRAAQIAGAAAVKGLRAPPGWTIVAVSCNGAAPLGFLAMHVPEARREAARTLLEVLPPLFAEQLRRRRILGLQRHALLRGVVTGPRREAGEIVREAAELGIALADAYWPALVAARHPRLGAAVEEQAQRAISPLAPAGHVAIVDGCLVLLYPAGSGAEGASTDWAHAAVERVHALAPATRVQAIVADGAVELSRLTTVIAELTTLGTLALRADPDRPVLYRRQYALERLLLTSVDARSARRFVQDQIGTLLAWDREHHSDLVGVVEAALDHPRHDEAARQCFMHRNTFRHRVQQADEVLGEGRLDDPDVRLAVRIALKLHRLASAR